MRPCCCREKKRAFGGTWDIQQQLAAGLILGVAGSIGRTRLDVAQLDRSLEKGATTLLLAVWRHKILFFLTAAMVFSSVVLVSLYIQPVYEGATLLIAGQAGLQQQVPEGIRKPAETAVALARVAESEEVVAEAVGKFGLQKLVQDIVPNRLSLSDRLRNLMFPSIILPKVELSPIEEYLPGIMLALSVKGELNSDIIRIAFRNKDPVVAANFANAIAQTFVDRQLALQSKPGATEFFRHQWERFEEDVKRASEELETFAVSTGIYAVDDQRQLLLRRLSDLSTAAALNRGSISDKAGQRQSLADQLRKLAPVARSSYVSALVDTLSVDRNAPVPRAGDSRITDDRSSDPPLLLIKVYQDSMAALFKVNSDLAGAQNMQKQQVDEVANLTAELALLSENEQKFARLKRAVGQATLNADLYERRMVEEQINAASNDAKFSSIKVLQKATIPLRPVFPNYILVAALGVMLGSAAGLGAALLSSRGGSH